MALLFEDKVQTNRAAFVSKVQSVAAQLGINPNWLMALMWNESGLNEKAQNPFPPYPVGLIQFVPQTAAGLGTSTTALYNMSNVTQLDYVKKYFQSWAGRIKSFDQLYLINFFPAAFNQINNSSYVFGSEYGDNYAREVGRVNPGFDLNKNGYVTMAEFKQYNRAKYPYLYDGSAGDIAEEESENNNSFLWLALGGYAGYLVATGQIKI